jgi:hypothetical protein
VYDKQEAGAFMKLQQGPCCYIGVTNVYIEAMLLFTHQWHSCDKQGVPALLTISTSHVKVSCTQPSYRVLVVYNRGCRCGHQVDIQAFQIAVHHCVALQGQAVCPVIKYSAYIKTLCMSQHRLILSYAASCPM